MSASRSRAAGVFFVVAPICSCPVALVSRNVFAVVPGCAKCFYFFLRPVGRRDLSAGPEKKKHHPGCCVFAPAGLLLPLPFAGAGAKKNNTLGGVFFCSGPAERSRRPTGRNKKKTLCTPGDDSKNISRNQSHRALAKRGNKSTAIAEAVCSGDAHSGRKNRRRLLESRQSWETQKARDWQ